MTALSNILDGNNIYLIDNLYHLIFNNSYINSQLPIPKKINNLFLWDNTSWLQ